jgi:hypothetical protein
VSNDCEPALGEKRALLWLRGGPGVGLFGLPALQIVSTGMLMIWR